MKRCTWPLGHVLFLVLPLLDAAPAPGQSRAPRQTGEAQWIWSTRQVEPGTSYFRKSFTLKNPVEGHVAIACQDRFELFVNGRKLASGDDWRVMQTVDIGKYLVDGRNAIAVKAENDGDVAGLVVRVTVRAAGGTFVAYSTDSSWRTSRMAYPQWYWPSFNDSQWEPARTLGEFGRAAPWYDHVRPIDGSAGSRFRLPPGFRVERVIDPDATGSLTTIAFDEWGNLLAAREGGPILRITDSDKDGIVDSVSTLTEEVKGVQGLLCVNGSVLAVGAGPDGAGLYRLDPPEKAGAAPHVSRLVKFTGEMAEHGPHAVAFGPDGCIYILIGNHTAPEGEISATSPYQNFYEGDLVQPKYEDAGGHAVGIKAPGGQILRTDLSGSFLERFAGGLRNAYGMVFNRDGELFTYDSDMEWDEGLPWYRPTRLLHVMPGAEFGWRSGWSKWPNYYLDSLPPILETGRGSPSGMDIYEHTAFPSTYQGAIFACDWTNGRILAITLRPAKGTYRATGETFVEGKPLNVTDCKVGPEGALYFCTGGRGTEGGIYRVVYENAPAPPRLSGIQKAVQQPQFFSAYSREAIAEVQEELDERWGPELIRVARDVRAPAAHRCRALDLLHLYGPFPTSDLLVALSRDANVQVRAKATFLMGQHADGDTHARILELLADEHATVRRNAWQALRRSGREAADEAYLTGLAEADRYVAWAARSALAARSDAAWKEKILAAESVRVFNQGAVAVLAAHADRETALAVLARAQSFLRGFLSDDDFVDLLRVMQLALHRGQLAGDDVPELREALREEFPANVGQNNPSALRINRELVRLAAHFQDEALIPRIVEQIQSRIPMEDRIHMAVHARFFPRGWTSEQKFAVLDFYEQARELEGGYSLARYIDNVARDFALLLTPQEQRQILDNAQEWPASALGVVAKLPEKLSPQTRELLIEIDRSVAADERETLKRLRTGIAAVLARSKDPQGMAYLRECFENEPERRAILAMALAQSPQGENWPLLIRSLPVLEGAAAVEVLQQLKRVPQVPEKADHVRQVILVGLRLNNDDARHALALLEMWFEEPLGKEDDAIEVRLRAAQEWFHREFPEEPPAVLPADNHQNRYTLADLEKFLSSKETFGDPARGAMVFQKAQCIKCHRFAGRGESIGPDLTTISRRFHKREVLESILFPSQVIPDQYASKIVLTTDGRQLQGIVGKGAAGELILLQNNGVKVVLQESEIDQMEPSRVSAMPEGLLNNLTLDEVADLFAYLYTPASGSRRTARTPAGRAK